MILRPLSSGKISGTGTIPCHSRIFGGTAISADGTNTAAVVIRENNSMGKIIFEISSKIPFPFTAPIEMRGTNVLYYDISGTNGSAMLYEWVT
jgi:hypothetical protein